MATPPSARRREIAVSTPPADSAGARWDGSGEHSPAWPRLSQDCPGGQEGSAQHVSSTQLPDTQSVGSLHAPPFGTFVAVGVTVGVLVTVPVEVTVGVVVALRVWVAVPVAVAVSVRVRVAVEVEVDVGVEA
jgi:hypothetical protein